MSRPIDADALYREVKAECNPYGKPTIEFEAGKKFLELIDAAPTIDTPSVRHGRWILLPNSTAPSKLFRCSECGNVTEHKHFSLNGYYSFCKDCGAKMDGGEDNGKAD